MRDVFNNIVEHKNLYIFMLIIPLAVLILATVTLSSHAFYANVNENLILTGNAETNDNKLTIYLQENEDGVALDAYVEATKEDITDQYIFNPEKSSCSNGKKIIKVNKDELVTSSDVKGSCEVYYDYISSDSTISTKRYLKRPNNSYKYIENLTEEQELDYILNPELSYCIQKESIDTESNITTQIDNGACVMVYEQKTQS